MNRAWAVIAAALAVSVAADVLRDAHTAFPGFYAVLGLAGSVALVAVVDVLGRLLRRPDPDATPPGPEGRDG